MSIDIIGGTRVRVTRDFAASPERLYRAFTHPDEAAAWMWGANAPNPTAEMDVRVGGRYHVAKDAPADDDSGWGTPRWAISGVYVELEPPVRLVFTLHWEGPVGYNQTGDEVLDEVAIVTLEPQDGGTRLVYEHVGIPDDGASAAEHGRGIAGTLDALAVLMDGPPDDET